MSSQVIKEKIDRIFEYLKILEKYKDISYQVFLEETHLIVERIFELLITTSTDILMHKMATEEESLPTTLRATFLRAGELNWIPTDLAQKLADAAGMRNILVYGYEKVDLKIIHDSIKPALKDYTLFCEFILKKISLELINTQQPGDFNPI